MNKFIQKIFILSTVVIISGCSSTKGVEVHPYMRVADRTDQEIAGKSGNWQGAPNASKPANAKSTRKVYVLEVSKEASLKDVENAPLQPSNAGNNTAPVESAPVAPETKDNAPAPKVVLPDFSKMDVKSFTDSSGKTISYVEYKVEKDDTLQKVAKKFYNSNAKWLGIYDANRDLIQNPNFLKPGMVIRIPVMK